MAFLSGSAFRVEFWAQTVEIGFRDFPDSLPAEVSSSLSIDLQSYDMLYAAPQLPSVATRTAQTVMLVDDDPYVREAGERMLKRLGYQVNAFGCPLEALEAFRRVPPPCDLVITDLTMPKMSGDELTRRMHSIAPSIPVVICSGYRPEDTDDSAIFDSCVTMSKPFTLMELQATVEAALQWIASV